ncbi:MAG: dTDP-4-dehydrorhamnose reductase [Verrucomicrobia bacterium]|nr:dTDP-4-dehydrorhamnose reductase [Verrucomicrobiota bacterium]
MKLWILGAEGMLGKALLMLCKQRGIEAFGTGRDEADITDLGLLLTWVIQEKPTHLINCAAYTDVDRAEREPEVAHAINAAGARNVAIAALHARARLIHISTDYVFDGEAARPYLETDACNPINVYGKSKWEGEKEVLFHHFDPCIVRTSWVFGQGGKNFLSAMIQLLKKEEEVQVVADQRGRPTSVLDLGEAILSLLDASGIFHFSGAGAYSRYEAALEILSHMPDAKCRRILPVNSDAYPRPARRPAYSVLDTTRFETLTGKKPLPFPEALSILLSAGVYV